MFARKDDSTRTLQQQQGKACCFHKKMQSPPSGGPRRIRSALPEASELALLNVISECTEFTNFGNIFKQNPVLFGSTTKKATKQEQKLREAVNSRRGYLFRNPSLLVQILEQRNFPVPDFILRSVPDEAENPQEEEQISRTTPKSKLVQQPKERTMSDNSNSYELNLEEPWKNPENILAVLVPNEQISKTEMQAKICLFM